jgi:hypothetical protein
MLLLLWYQQGRKQLSNNENRFHVSTRGKYHANCRLLRQNVVNAIMQIKKTKFTVNIMQIVLCTCWLQDVANSLPARDPRTNMLQMAFELTVFALK